MKISFDGWDFIIAAQNYLKEKYSIELDSDKHEIYPEIKFINTPNLCGYKKTTKWNRDKLEYDVLAEYKVEGLFVKRKKVGSKNYEYVRFDYDNLTDTFTIGEQDEIDINIY